MTTVTQAQPSCEAGPSRHAPGQWLARAAQLFIALWVLFYLIQGLGFTLTFDGAPVNGPFQLYNPLRRIAAGQVPGRDFVFFHGIGVPYLHYPLFALFGGKTLIASELSRQWTSILLFVISLAAFAWAALRRSARVWVGMAVAIMVLEVLFPGSAAPGHSLVSGRSTMPVITFALLQLRLRDWLKAVLVGSSIALAFVLGTEHALSLSLALIAVVGVSVLQALTGDRKAHVVGRNIRFTALALAVAAGVTTLLLLLVAGMEGARKALHYSLVELPADQFWFFGSPPMPFFGSWKELLVNRHLILILMPTYVALGILAWVLTRSWKRPLQFGRDWRAVAAFMLIYGVLSGVPLLGILSRHYVFPLARVMVLVAMLVYASGAMPRIPRLAALTDWRGWPAATAATFVALCIVAGLGLAVKSTTRTLQLLRPPNSPAPLYDKHLSKDWDAFMAGATRLIASHQERSRLSLWSAYSALLEAHYGVFSPAEDYIIHAVGPQRWKHYIQTFRNTDPEFVTTMTPIFSFEEWLQDERWEFYEALLDNYQPLGEVSHAMIWHRKPGPWREPSQDFQTVFPGPGGAYSVQAEDGGDRIAVVRVRYYTSNRFKSIPLLGQTPRYLANLEGTPRNLAVSFPPYATEFQFPVQLPAGHPVKVRFSVASLLPAVQFNIEEVEFKTMAWEPSQKQIFAYAGQHRY
jgi:hypothetical protein